MMDTQYRQLLEEVSALRQEVKTLRAIEDVKRTKYKYWRCFDTADVEGMAEVLHKDVTLSVVAGIYSMELKGRDAYVSMVKEGAHAEMISQHNGHHGEIDIISDEEAIGTWYLFDNLYEFRRGFRLYGTAFYRDRYVKDDGVWKIHYSQFHRLYEIKDEISNADNVTFNYLSTHAFKHPEGVELPPYEKLEGYEHPPGIMPPFLDAR